MRKDILTSLMPHMDAKTSAFLEQELEAIETELYKVEYPELKWRRHIPINSNFPEGTETTSYRVFDIFGQAKFLANYAEDLADVEVLGEKFSARVEGIGNGYSYSTQDLRAAALAGFPLEREKAQAAREFHERLMDKTAALGNKKHNFEGFLKYTGVPVDTAAATGSGSSTKFEDKTPENILLDLHEITRNQVEATEELHSPDTMLLPVKQFGQIATTPMSNDNSATILDRFLATNPYITTVETWNYLKTADEAGTGPRLMVYRKQPRIVEARVIMEVMQQPPERRGLRFFVPMESRFGGVVCRFPLAMRYMDGI